MSGRSITLLALSPILIGAHPQNDATSTPDSDTHPWAESCEKWDEWDKPGPAYKIFANTYYVGTCGIASILITTRDGHIVIDSGTDVGADIVLANIRSLGFNPKDIKAIVMSHEHYDHVGGLAKIQHASGAPVYASPIAAKVLRRGVPDDADPQVLSEHPQFPPITGAIHTLTAETRIAIGHILMRPIFTPGHSPGATSWVWEDGELDVVQTLVYADSLSPVSAEQYRFSDNPEYLANYRAGVARISRLGRCLLITPHPSSSNMRNRLKPWGLASKTRQDCKEYANAIEQRLEARLKRESDEA